VKKSNPANLEKLITPHACIEAMQEVTEEAKQHEARREQEAQEREEKLQRQVS
jgi:hypothetical protein